MKRLFFILTTVIVTCGCSTRNPPPPDFQPPKKVLAQNHPFKWNVNEGMLGVRFGIHSEGVAKYLGQPTERYGQPGQNHSWQYHTLGLLIGFDELDRVVSFSATDGRGDPNGWLVAFKGVTEKGVQMGSSEKEIIQAYGTPSSIKTYPDGTLQLLYSSSGYRLVFMLKNGNVNHLTAVRKPISQNGI